MCGGRLRSGSRCCGVGTSAGPISRADNLPKSWTDDPERCRLAGVPEQVGFRTKPELAGDMIEAALDAGVVADFAVGDEAYGPARETEPSEPGMIPLTCNEIRHLLVSATTRDLDWQHRLRWSTWRRRHQATARQLHYQRQLTLAA